MSLEFFYARFACKWLIGVKGPKGLCLDVNESLIDYLVKVAYFNIKISEFIIKEAVTNSIEFLGILISVRLNKPIKFWGNNAGLYRLLYYAPIKKLETYLEHHGFVKKMKNKLILNNEF